METKWTHHFVSVKMYVFYIDILFLRQWVAVFSDETPSSPAGKWSLCEKRRQVMGCFCVLKGKYSVGM